MLLDNINYIFITDNSKALKDIPMKERKKILAFDIGGTKIAYALIDEKGKICGEITKVSTPRDSREILTTLKSVVSGFEDVIDAVAVATAGEVSKNNDRIIASVGNMPKDYMNTPFKELSEKPVVVENDANAAMWAEYRLGAAKGMKDAMLVAIGTDDSGRVWINGKDVWRDYGTSWYNIDEHITPFQFRQGWNRILVRLENGGGGACGFSFLIIPQE